MRIEIDRQKRITLLNWLKQGFICPDDMPEVRSGQKPITPQEARDLIRQLEEKY